MDDVVLKKLCTSGLSNETTSTLKQDSNNYFGRDPEWTGSVSANRDACVNGVLLLSSPTLS